LSRSANGFNALSPRRQIIRLFFDRNADILRNGSREPAFADWTQFAVRQ